LNSETLAPAFFDAANEDIQPLAPVAPPLWNPDAAACWSLLLTPAFGAYLQMKNWAALGEDEEAAASRRWFVGVLVLLLCLPLLELFAPGLPIHGIANFIGLPLLLAWYYASARPQARYIRQRFGKSYARRGWGRALLAALLVLLIVGVASAVLGFAAGLFGDAHPVATVSQCGARCL
jgi:hypothetical protein